MYLHRILLTAVFVALWVALPATAAEKPSATQQTYSAAYGKTGEQPKVDASEMPRIPFTPLDKALATFQIKKGFRLELAAAEPLVADPIAIAFDENHRMFVVDMIDYSERREENPHLGRIQMLEDSDGDGRFDKATTYVDDLPWPTAVACYGGGIFVAASPDILWFKDTDGDGKADVRKVVFTGFGSGREKLNVQAMLNSFNWGLDNRIHGASGPNGGVITNLVVAGSNPVSCNGRDFSFDPRSFDFATEPGGGQHGFSYDSRGRKYVCSNSDHLQAILFDPREAVANPLYNLPSSRVSIAADGPAAEVFRISPDEPWRILRTHWRVTGKVPGMIEGGGRVSGYFTGATGGTIYRGDAYGEAFLDNAFIGDAGGNLVHRKRILPEGAGLVARRPADEEKVEFLASEDIWFRPVQFANAPDGCLYVCDMYREVIEHPWSLPENIKQHLDLNSGNDRGRIYRIVPETFQQPKPVLLGRLSTPELVAFLGHSNGWHRDTAARLLFERQGPDSVEALNIFVGKSKAPLGRMHALYALAGLKALRVTHLLEALRDSDERVREHAVKLAGAMLAEHAAGSEALQEPLLALAGDPSVAVRFRAAFALGHFKGGRRLLALAEIIRQDPGDPWIQAAVLSSIQEGAASLFLELASEARMLSNGPHFLTQAIQMAGQGNRLDEVSVLLKRLAHAAPDEPVASWMRSLDEGLKRAGSSLDKADAQGKLKSLFERSAQTASDTAATETLRVQAIHVLGIKTYEESGATLSRLLASTEPQAVQLAALQTFARYSHSGIGSEILDRWPAFSPRLRSDALAAMLSRPDRAKALLEAVKSGRVRASDLSSTQAKFLREHTDKAISQLAAMFLEVGKAGPRQAAIEQFRAAIQMRGDVARGQAIYAERCVSCHRAGSLGTALGPDFVTVKNGGPEKLLVNILDPNREVAPQFTAYVVETKDDESHLGLIVNENASSVTVRQAFGVEITVPRSSIKRMLSQGQSIMPEGLETGLTLQGMADLLEFIMR